jgi:hypothetical protein
MISTNKKLKVGEFVKVVITKVMPFGLEGDYVK